MHLVCASIKAACSIVVSAASVGCACRTVLAVLCQHPTCAVDQVCIGGRFTWLRRSSGLDSCLALVLNLSLPDLVRYRCYYIENICGCTSSAFADLRASLATGVYPGTWCVRVGDMHVYMCICAEIVCVCMHNSICMLWPYVTYFFDPIPRISSASTYPANIVMYSSSSLCSWYSAVNSAQRTDPCWQRLCSAGGESAGPLTAAAVAADLRLRVDTQEWSWQHLHWTYNITWNCKENGAGIQN